MKDFKKKSADCPCGAKVWLFRSIDKLASGMCNKCIREVNRPIINKDKRGNIYTECYLCEKKFRFFKSTKFEGSCSKCQKV